MSNALPTPSPLAGLRALRAMAREKSTLAALDVFRRELGDIFELRAFGFTPIVMSGPAACRWVLVEARHDLLWRMKSDPITQLLSHGLLVEDGAAHDSMRELLNGPLHRRMVDTYVAAMVRRTDQVIDSWTDGATVDLLIESRRIALLILFDTLFGVDFTPDLQSLRKPLLKLVDFIAPGAWMFWSGIPRPGYGNAIDRWNTYFRELISARRRAYQPEHSDLLSLLIMAGVPDSIIRDQLMTMLVAGHDTVTALVSWAFHLLGRHDEARQRATAEADAVFSGQPPTAEIAASLKYTQQIVDETLRLYPPAHLGSRITGRDLEFDGYAIPRGCRVVYSMYLTHRDPAYWPEPERFDPNRFAPGCKHEPYTYLPFGGGKRNCVGAVFAQIEARLVISRILQRVALEIAPVTTRIHMGATLEPRPGVPAVVRRR